MLHIQRQFSHIWRVFLKIKIHWKNRLNISFHAKSNALPESLILIDKIDPENLEKEEKKDGMLHTHRYFLIFDEFFQD